MSKKSILTIAEWLHRAGIETRLEVHESRQGGVLMFTSTQNDSVQVFLGFTGTAQDVHSVDIRAWRKIGNLRFRAIGTEKKWAVALAIAISALFWDVDVSDWPDHLESKHLLTQSRAVAWNCYANHGVILAPDYLKGSS